MTKKNDSVKPLDSAKATTPPLFLEVRTLDDGAIVIKHVVVPKKAASLPATERRPE
jgi:hypothetical protein